MPMHIALPSSYVLVIAEKPRAAEKIARALGSSTARKIYVSRVPVWIVKWMGRDYVISSAAGHLYTLHSDTKGYPVFDCRWVPRYLVDEDAKHTKRFLEVLEKLCRNAYLYINACDYDIEGSLIGYLIIAFLGDPRRAFRAKFSSLTPAEILNAFRNLSRLDLEMVEAGECRHILDWWWGINVSRALMDLYAKFDKPIVLSAGRVQTPTLAHAVEVTLSRALHVPEPLIVPLIYVDIAGSQYLLTNLDEPFRSRKEAEEYLRLVRSRPIATIERVEVKEEIVPPPPPFNLPDLQYEAYRIHRISPYRTQQIAEDLYLDALISYPRTNSQRLPPTLNNRAILEKLKRAPQYRDLVETLLAECRGVLKPHNGPKEDPAHPAIHPTGELPEKTLPSHHRKIYDLIVRRYLATFASPARLKHVKVFLDVHGRRYLLEGIWIVQLGWYRYYPFSKPKERELPLNLIKTLRTLPIAKATLRLTFTSPPPAITRYSLLKWMEEQGIGTESTRAEIIETLYRRKYIVRREKSAEASDLGIAIVNILKKYVPELTSVDLTRKFEEYLEQIRQRRLRCVEVLNEAKALLTNYLERLKSMSNVIAKEFGMYIESSRNTPPCRICKRIAYKDGFCVFHYEAYKRILEKAPMWRSAGYEWREYLKKLVSLKKSGRFVREVAEYLLRSFTTISIGRRSL